MTDKRAFLAIGTTVELDNDVYQIIGDPIGCGGGSVLYPVQKQVMQNGILQMDGIMYALKECYPAASTYSYTRMESGEIIPACKNTEDLLYLHQAQLMQLEEKTLSQNIYRTASRMLPIRSSAQSVGLTLPGQKKSSVVPNTMTLMDSLAEKGQSLTAWIKQKRRFAPAEAFRIIQQVLFALQEVHEAGYLHLDIQDGNIFFRGSLEQKNEMATLIDFGCARKLINGKTEPIRDKMIFTTQGFSAPEILLHNDGNLQLGPEADIYSVGCLALYLLTGQRANVRELIANRTGLYLRSNQLRRIQCPKHLIGTMQRILARALAKEPENRYHSVKDMLDEVTPLTEALQPKSTILGAVKYDAFVCYKHGSIDSVAALTLQRALENYRAPKGVADKRRPFDRVFVDEGELSSCADFGQQIRDALKNSEWLIVICSPDTPLSPWVQLEIDTFLEYHDRSRILAVLTGGNPDRSFPPQLKGDTNDVGEVFAAHAISSTPQEAEKQLKGDAMLKIAAPMLNTTFDTLKQRQKIYRLQRIAAITAGFLLASVGFAAYAMNRAKVIAEQAARIEEEYERSLINESLFLAEQAEKKLADNDPLGAMELVLQALPSEKQDRPVLPEAEYALGKALGIYRTPSVAEDTATPVGKINTDCPYFFLSTDGKQLFTWDDATDEFGSKIQCWNTENLSMLWEVFLDYEIFTHPVTSSADSLYVMGYHSVCCIDAATGSERWSVSIANAKAMALSQDESKLLLISEESAEDNQNSEVGLRLTATLFDADSGEELRQDHIYINGDMRIEGPVCISPDLQFVAIPTVDNSNQDFTWHSYNSLYLADLEAETCDKLLDSQTAICDMLFIEDKLALIRGNGYTLTTQHNVLYEYNAQYAYWMELFDIHACSLVWQKEITDHFETGGICKILQTNYDDGNKTGNGLLYIFDDHCALLDQNEGKFIRKYRLSAAAVDVSLTETGFETVNTDGSYTVATFSIDTVMNIQYFSPVISEAYQMDDVYFVQNETQTNHDHTIYKYQLNRFDDAYVTHFTADSNTWKEYRGCVMGSSDNVLLTNRNQVCLTDISTGETWQHTIPEEYGFSDYRIVAVDAENGCLYWSEAGHWDDPKYWVNESKYYILDFATGNIAELIQPPQPHEKTNTWDVVFANDMALVAATWYTNQQEYLSVYTWDLTNGTLSELWQYALLPAPSDAEGEFAFLWESYLQGSLVYNAEKEQVCFGLYENYSEILTKIICLNIDTQTVKEIPLQIIPEEGTSAYESWGKRSYHWNTPETQSVFTYNNRIIVVDLGGNLICDISVTEPIASLQYSPDEQYILAVSQSGVLSKYRIDDSNCCVSVNLAEHCNSLYTVYADEWTWEFLDNSTLLVVSNFGGFLMDVSEEYLKMKAIVDQCIGYDPNNDRFITVETNSYSGKNTTIGSFQRYTVGDLIRKANAILNK